MQPATRTSPTFLKVKIGLFQKILGVPDTSKCFFQNVFN